MKNAIKSTLIFVSLLTGLFSHAQSKKIENSVLWEVSGNGLSKPSYLFGTVHMICAKDFVMKTKATNAFSKTSKLVLEVNMADNDEMKLMQQSAIGKEPLSKTLSPKQKELLEKTLHNNGGLTLAQVDNYTLETVMSLLFVNSFGCSTDIKFYEMEFISKAKETNKPIAGLEKVSEQIDFLNKSFTDDELLSYFDQINPGMCNTMVKDYLNEDITSLYTMSTDVEMMSPETKKILLDNRNENWSKKMPELMKKESVFFAVGAAHLAGDTGVINLLRKAGYTVKPILN